MRFSKSTLAVCLLLMFAVSASKSTVAVETSDPVMAPEERVSESEAETGDIYTSCENAIHIQGPFDTPLTIKGSISLGDVDEPCGINSNCVGVWYYFYATAGEKLTVTTCGNYTTGADTVIALTDGCGQYAKCLEISDDECRYDHLLSTITIDDALSSYILYVTAFGSYNGTYELTISQEPDHSVSSTPFPGNPKYSATNTPKAGNSGGVSSSKTPSFTRTRTGTPSRTPANSRTPTATPSRAAIGSSCQTAEIVTGAIDVQRSTLGSPSYYSTCSGTANNAPAYWFELDLPVGSGVTLSTCSGSTDFDTQIGVINSCYSGSCLQFADDDNNCPVASASYLYFEVESPTYYVFVTGYGGVSGDFELIVTVN